MKPGRYLKIMAPLLCLTLTACAQRSEVRQIRQEVTSLNHQMDQLSDQSVALSRQNALNAASEQGAYLLPNANGPAKLYSQLGTLVITLDPAQNIDGRMQTVMHIHTQSGRALPAFTAAIVWGQLTGTVGHPVETETRHKTVHFPATSTTVDQSIELPGLIDDDNTFIRVHNIQPVDQ
ncbi:DUF3251 domain-containing protein [Shimwellia pseudoproteus]|uniref:DUF3251 domain-containing protein n=1 Tax=Shimwellia pseudoproteus TaxID=570012 RepID=UPI0018EAA77C|nr:DUF3251 domain-containing protein [Shimwellia pseudoproteus]MBJ3814790.1 DUF3251 domain-containing protein [Shimwellia pseudoproteus]